MGDLLKVLGGLFSGGAGAAVGTVATLVGIIAALAPVGIFLVSDKSNEIFISVTYREGAFWGAVGAINLLVAYLTRRNAA
jgi:hypothetical protein